MDTEASRFNHAVGAQLKAEIAAHNETVKGIAERAGIARSSLVKYLSGERPIPVTSVYLIAEELEMTAETIIIRAAERFDAERQSTASVTPLRPSQDGERWERAASRRHDELGSLADDAD